MSSNINYSITDQDGAIVIRQTAKSFNLDHITDKDIVSFYRNFSSSAMFDTGLMPLSGTGVLAIRNAGNHTQITFQHAPQINLINWGANENDPEAKTYNVAQPYRIWIGDLIDGDMFGARMFYSLYPITSPDQPLYHLNLPNTNCKGYRGTSVGWQCLYHNESWSDVPFNEKIVRFAERCSGVETYNDANMNETDGPRFYADKNMPSYIWDPIQWQSKTQTEGLNWVFDESNWIPVLVKDQDDQDKHCDKGIPLTIQMAMLGNYQAYYTDPYRPKPINILSRSDLKLESKKVTDWIAKSHNFSLLSDVSYNSMDAIKEFRIDHNAKSIKIVELGGHDIDDEDEADESDFMTITCPISGKQCSFHEDEAFVDSNNATYCQPCFSENIVHCENSDKWIFKDDDRVVWIEHESIYVDSNEAIFQSCDNCSTLHWVPDIKNSLLQWHHVTSIYQSASENYEFCSECLPDKVNSSINNLENKVDDCYGCGTTVVKGPDWSHIFPTPKIIGLNANEIDGKIEPKVMTVVYCPTCSTQHIYCPTGHFVKSPNQSLISLPKEYIITVVNGDDVIKTSLTSLCAECISEDLIALIKKISIDPSNLSLNIKMDAIINPFSSNAYALERYQKSVIEKIAFSGYSCVDLDNPKSPF